MTTFGAFIRVFSETSLHLLAARTSGEDWGTWNGPKVEKNPRCRLTVHDHPRIRRVNVSALFFYARGIAQPHRFRLSEWEISNGRQSSPRLSFPNRTGELPGTGPNNGEVKIVGPGLTKFTLSHIDADRITSVGFQRATVQAPGGWGGNGGKEPIKRHISSRWNFTDSLLTVGTFRCLAGGSSDVRLCAP